MSVASIAAVVAAALAMTFAAPAWAGPGVVEIGPADVLAGGVTAGDGPGFPATVSEAGSYRLTGDLVVETAGINAIEITADDVTLELGGFSVRGPLVGAGNGVTMTGRSNVEVRNGAFYGFTRGIVETSLAGRGHRVIRVRARLAIEDGIYLRGSYHLVRDCTASDNGGAGIDVGDHSLVRGNVAEMNRDAGLRIGLGSVVTDNVARSNSMDGLDATNGSVVSRNTSFDNGRWGMDAGFGSVVRGNTVTQNEREGIRASSGTAVVGNASSANSGSGLLAVGTRVGYADNFFDTSDGDPVTGGTQIGGNACGFAPCP